MLGNPRHLKRGQPLGLPQLDVAGTPVVALTTAENVRNYPSADRAIDAGADPADVVRAAYEATFNALFLLTSEEDIQELAASGAAVGLHEDLLSADPTGDGGRDLFA